MSGFAIDRANILRVRDSAHAVGRIAWRITKSAVTLSTFGSGAAVCSVLALAINVMVFQPDPELSALTHYLGLHPAAAFERESIIAVRSVVYVVGVGFIGATVVFMRKFKAAASASGARKE